MPPFEKNPFLFQIKVKVIKEIRQNREIRKYKRGSIAQGEVFGLPSSLYKNKSIHGYFALPGIYDTINVYFLPAFQRETQHIRLTVLEYRSEKTGGTL